jgi:isoaspartyl peptidase/L-asparaginase-like protein (Ntn-hydrolase superfamily)
MRVVVHGGTHSKPWQRSGPRRAARRGVQEKSPAAAVAQAVKVLEDDPRFNAGTGAAFRLDGRTIEMDAAVMDSEDGYGAVANIQAVANPVLVAQALVRLPTNILSGDAATRFARRLGHPEHDPATDRARKQHRRLVRQMGNGKAGRGQSEWRDAELRAAWNYKTPFEEVFPDGLMPGHGKGGSQRASDTVGAVATDGERFAAAASTGGCTSCLLSRIGDTPTLGAGLMATRAGAVACTGLGDHILRQRLASRVTEWLEDGVPAQRAADRAIALFPDWVDVGVVTLTSTEHGMATNRRMAWDAAGQD